MKISIIPLLLATILIDEEENASVRFEKLHPDLVINEYVRLALHYYAKILFNFDPNQPESIDAYKLLKSAIDKISSANLSHDSNILRLADIDDVVRLSKPGGKCYRYEAKLFALSAVQRRIKTKIPFPKGYLQHMAFSVLILIHGVLQHLDESAIEVMKLSFKYMNEQYKSGIDYKQMKNIASVPINAYTSALMSDERTIFSDFVIIPCPNPDGCSKELKIPKNKKSKKFRCPDCFWEFKLNKD